MDGRMDGRMDRRGFPADQDAARARRRARRRGAVEEEEHEGVYLASIAAWIPTIYGADRPLVGALLSEDTCWVIARDDWRGRRPPLWHRSERAAWRVEAKLLEQKRTRIAEQAVELGFAPSPDART